jgi:hypothetical protein
VATAPAAFAQTTSPEAFAIEGTGLLGVMTASAITSACLANANGTFVETTSIASGSIAGTAIPATIPANDAFLNIPLVATVTLNQQVAGPITGSVTVNAINIRLLGSTEQVNIASSTCGPFSASTPIAGGKGLAVGLGLLGSVGVGYGAIYTRRRRTAVI